jgi:lipoyl(octanoyl) transferase
VTGKVESGETLEQGAFREVAEETGIREPIRLVNAGYGFEFEDARGRFRENVFGLEVKGEAIALSREHQAFRWMDAKEALTVLRWEEQREGLRRVLKRLSGIRPKQYLRSRTSGSGACR